jgi:branched-chain amino acid transport system permease protein
VACKDSADGTYPQLKTFVFEKKAWRMTVAPRIAMVVALASALAGCAPAIDAGQARLCRAIIPAINATGDSIEIVGAAPLGSGEGVRVAYRARAPAGAVRARFVECRFAPANPASPAEGGLVGVTLETGPLGEVRLQILKRFWLDKEGAAADPEPVANAARAPHVPHLLAAGLQHAVSALPPIAIYALLASAYSLVYGLVGRINLAFGELAAVSGYAAFLAFALAGAAYGAAGSLALALMLALSAALAHGVAVGRFVFAPLMQRTGQQVLIGTIALAIVLQEYLRLAQGSKLVWVPPLLNTPHALARSGGFVVTVTPVAIGAAGLCLLATLALLALMRFSRFGRAWRACADDPLAAALFGVDRTKVLLQTFALASALAGLAGYVVTIYYGAFGYAGGVVLGLKSLIAAIAGGIGSVPGAFLGGVLIGSVEALWSALFPIEFRDLAVYALLVIFLLLRPGGLLGFDEAMPPKG